VLVNCTVTAEIFVEKYALTPSDISCGLASKSHDPEALTTVRWNARPTER
jgi:hypothetical protein